MPKQTYITPTTGDDGQSFDRAFEVYIPLDRGMQSPRDIAGALDRLAKHLRDESSNPDESYEVLVAFPRGYVTDENDRTAGTWQVVEA